MPSSNFPSCAKLAACGPGQRWRQKYNSCSLHKPVRPCARAKFALRCGFVRSLEAGAAVRHHWGKVSEWLFIKIGCIPGT